MFNSIIGSELTPAVFFTCLGVALVLGIIVAIAHQKTTRSSSNFVTTLAVLPMLVSMAIMLVNGNLGAGVATVGIFSLVRFRSIPGNSRSVLAVFFSMAIGLAVGTGYVTFAALFTVITAAVIAFLKFINFGESASQEKKLTILVPEDIDYTDIFDDVFANYTNTHTLEKSKTTNMGSMFELTYRINLKKNVNEKEFIDKIRVKNGNLKVSLSHPLNEEEL